MLNLEASFKIESLSDISDIDTLFQEIATLYRTFVYDLKYIFIETGFTHRLLKKKSEYVYENLRKTLEDNPNVVIVETDLTYDPKVKNVPIIKDVEFYKKLMKFFDGYVAFKYNGPLQQTKQCIDYLSLLNYCDFCSYTMIYQIDLYSVMDKSSDKDESINFIYVKVLTA
jgi:hypothetical protein